MSTQPDSTPKTPVESSDKGVGCDALLGLRANTQGIALMRDGLLPDARESFDRFVKRALAHDFSKVPAIREHLAMQSANPREKDRRLLLLRAFVTRDGKQVGIHARIYLRGEYGVLLS